MVSVIMLTYNRKGLVGNMIEDILNQTYKNFEFIIVDNGSTDGTADLVEDYAQEDRRIKVLHVEKGSIGYGRNIGVKASEGEYITFVDDDDRASKDLLEFLYNNLIANNADVSICGTTEIFNNEEEKPQCVNREKLILYAQDAVEELLKREKIRAGLPAKMFKRELIEKNLFKENKCHEDIHTTYRYLADANIVIFYGLPKYCFIKHVNSISYFTNDGSAWTKEKIGEYLEAFHDRSQYLENKFPEMTEFVRYCEWSYMISMCEKIDRYNLEKCEDIEFYMKKELIDNFYQICNCKYVKESEKELMKKFMEN